MDMSCPHVSEVVVCLLTSDSKDIQQVGCAWIIKIKMGESTGLLGAPPASLIIHQRLIHLQTAGILTNV